MAGQTELARIVVRLEAETAQMRRSLDQMDRRMRTTANVAREVQGIYRAIMGAVVVREIVRNTEQSQRAIAQLGAVLKSTSGAAGKTMADLERMGDALQKTTIYGDEATHSAQALLLTFTNIKGGVFDQATRTVLDMSTALGQDLKQGAIQVGKALQDPILGVTALRRVGVNFTEAQKEVIKNLVETGRAAEAQQLILKELQVEFGGSAEAARKTLGGAIQFLKNQLSDFFEITPQGSTGFVDAINAMGEAVGWVREHAIVPFFGGIQILAAEAAVKIGEIELAISRVGDTAKGGALAGIAAAAGAFLPGAGEAVMGLAGSQTMNRSVETAEENLRRLREAAEDVKREMMSGAGAYQSYARGAAGAADGVEELTEAEKKRAEELKKMLRVGAGVTDPNLEAFAVASEEVIERFRKAQRDIESGKIKLFDLKPSVDNFRSEADRLEVIYGNTIDNLKGAIRDYGDEFVTAITDAVASGTLKMESFFDVVMTGLAAIIKKARETGDEFGERLGAAVSGATIGYQSASAGRGMIGGAAAGYGIAGPAGAVVGAVSGLVGGLLGAAQKAREAERAMRAATRAFVASMEDVVAGITAGDDWIERLRQQVNAWLAAMEEATGARYVGRLQSGWSIEEMLRQLIIARDKLAETSEQWEAINAIINAFLAIAAEEQRRAAEEAAEAIRDAARAMEEAAEAARRMREDLIGRGMTAVGQGDLAAQFALRARHRRERQEALAANDPNFGLLVGVQKIEAEALAITQALERQTRAIEEAAASQIADLEIQISAIEATSSSQIKALEDQADAINAAAESQIAAIEEQAVQVRVASEIQLSALKAQEDAIREASEAQIAAIEEQVKAAEEQLRVARDSLRAQEDLVGSLRQAVETLGEFQRSLLLGSASPLSPVQRLGEARSQFEMIAALARSGDVVAAQDIPEAARALLDESRAYFASSAGFVAEFERVQAVLADVGEQYSGRLTVEEQILSELQAQTTKLQEQVDSLRSQADSIREAASRQIDALRGEMDGLRSRADQQIAELQAQSTSIREKADAQIAAIDAEAADIREKADAQIATLQAQIVAIQETAAAQIAALQAAHEAEMTRLWEMLQELIKQTGIAGSMRDLLGRTDEGGGSVVDDITIALSETLGPSLANLAIRVEAVETAVYANVAETRKIRNGELQL